MNAVYKCLNIFPNYKILEKIISNEILNAKLDYTKISTKSKELINF